MDIDCAAAHGKHRCIAGRPSVPEELLGFPEQLEPMDGELISEKMHGNAFQEADLGDRLRALDVSTVILSGLASQSCVYATLAGAV